MLTKLSDDQLIAEINKLNDCQKYKVFRALQIAYYAEDFQNMLDDYKGEDDETTRFVQENFDTKQYAAKFFDEAFDDYNPISEMMQEWFEEGVARMLAFPKGDGR